MIMNIDIDMTMNNKKGTSSVRENRDGQPNSRTAEQPNGRKKPDVEVGAPPKKCAIVNGVSCGSFRPPPP